MRRVIYVNRWVGLAQGTTIAEIAAEHAEAIPRRCGGSSSSAAAAVSPPSRDECIALLAVTPAVAVIPPLAALGLVSTFCAAVVAFEATPWREQRLRLRHPDVAA
jgi:hypothetical protein